ncbi:probable glycosyltransferase protein [Rhizobium etli CFN 42]|uniref:Probable glycosyltransferase protein n=1 Tax=Rhizobium etli (strain ATCC 51251 / DSM 11541 / JCM 21823 / NBRC 15573 / CFN 42) TaxID=347834 RepID=Q2KC74_RHIEC|nr:glycosyltransferase family 4 protein [Rhizobium etli]ABC89562.1 probable glycosyltransferase protein [Rhizobium etli CFN 42]
MRVLHFFKTYWPDTFGGVERTIHAIAKGTQKHGICSEVLSLSPSPDTNTMLFDGHMAYKAKLDFEFASTGFSRDVFRHFRKLSKEADIIHFHFPWPLMDIVDLATRHGKPAIVTYHSDIVKQKTLLKFYRPLMSRFLRGMDRIVATSPNYLQSSEVLRAFSSKTSVIPLGLSEGDYPVVAEEAKARWRSRLPKRFFLFIGVLRYYKGVHVLLEAARQTGFDVVLIGNGPTEDELKRTVRQQNLSNVHFLGGLPDADKVAILDLSLGLVFPSHLRSEAFGLSLVEAAMRGKPMISCEIGTGTSFVNLDGETGLVIPPNDTTALSQAMARLWNDDPLAISYGVNARQRYEVNFTAERMAQSYAELYRNVAGSR